MKVLRGRKARQSILRSAVREEKTANWRAFGEDFTEPQGGFSAVQTAWRRERDSNPRYGFPYIGFQDRLFQPLTHPSARLSRVYQGRGRVRRVTFGWRSACAHIGALPRRIRSKARVQKANRPSCPSLPHSLGVTTIEETADNPRIEGKTNSRVPRAG